MSSLQKLPNELLLRMFNHFSFDETKSEECYSEDMRALASMSLQCKLFQLLANPLLYHTFIKPANVEMAPQLGRPGYIHPLANPNIRLRKYLRTLLSRSDLAHLVRTLILRPWHTTASHTWFDPSRDQYSTFIVPQSEDLLCFPKSLMPLSHTDDFWTDFRAGEEDAEVALLLHLTCNIEQLEFNFPSHKDSDTSYCFYFRQLLQEAARRESERPFRRLRRLSVRNRWFDIVNIAELISLPSVMELITYGATGDETFATLFPEFRTNIVSMRHRRSHLSDMVLTSLVKNCECLKSFEITYANSWTSWRDTMTSISSQSANIEVLAFDTLMDGRFSEGIDGLKHFHRLKHFRVGENTLLGSDGSSNRLLDEEHTDCTLTKVLPPSLETLTIVRSSWACEPALRGLLVSLPRTLPNLRSIILGSSDDVTLLTPFDVALIASRFAALKRGFKAYSVDLIHEGIDIEDDKSASD